MNVKATWHEEFGKIKSLIKAHADFEAAHKIVSRLKETEIPDGSDVREKRVVDALHLRSLAAEICDYYGDFGQARKFVEQAGNICYSHLKTLAFSSKTDISSGKTDISSGELILQQVWVVLQAGLCEYRSGKLDSAFEMFDLCRVISSGPFLVSEDRPRFGTQARSLYSLGLVQRERYEPQSAIQYLTRSAELAYRSWYAEVEKGRVPSALIAVAIARSLGMGLAVVHTSHGRPDLAIPLLLCSRAMLPPTEKIISTHIDLIMATLPSWSYPSAPALQTQPDNNGTTIDKLLKCYALFKEFGHRLYQTRAAYHIAREFIRLFEAGKTPGSKPNSRLLSEAEKYIPELQFSVSGNWGFALRAIDLTSQIDRLRGLPDRSEERARWALEQSSPSRYPAIYLDLLMTRALARMARADYCHAIEDLRTGLRLASAAADHRLTALFHLRLSQAYFRDGAFREASVCHRHFLDLKPFLGVETSDTRAVDLETKQLIESHQDDDYILRLNDSLDPAEEQKKFRRALVRWARDKAATDDAAAKKLGITRQTLYNWQK